MRATTLELGRKIGRLIGQVQDKISFRLAEPEIDRVFVVSNIVVTLGYDADRRCLQAEYYSGHLYRIDGVSPEAHQNLIGAAAFDHVFQHEICADHKMTCIGCLLPVFR